jgi:hypothetical protein
MTGRQQVRPGDDDRRLREVGLELDQGATGPIVADQPGIDLAAAREALPDRHVVPVAQHARDQPVGLVGDGGQFSTGAEPARALQQVIYP